MYNNHPFNRSIYATLIQISSLSQNMCWLTKIKVDSSLHSKRQSICEHLKYNVLIFNKACVCVHTPIQRVLGALSLGVKRLWREADHSLPSRAEVKSAWSYTSTPKSVFMAWWLVRNRGNFAVAFIFICSTSRQLEQTVWRFILLTPELL